MLNLVRDTLGLVAALGYRTVAGIVGHDFGSPVAGCGGRVRPIVMHLSRLMTCAQPAYRHSTAQA